MNILAISELEKIEGGRPPFVDGLCDGLAGGSLVYGAGVLLNIWNPIGWGGAVALAGANLTCHFTG